MREKLDSAKLFGEAESFVQTLVSQTGLDLHSRLELENGVVHVWLDGEDADVVLADNARLLYAINHLLNQAFYRRSLDGLSFVVDCQDYRSTRTLELHLLARKAAERVRRSGRPFKLQAMPAGERRIIHLALAGEKGVRTESEGAGQKRSVVIYPSR